MSTNNNNKSIEYPKLSLPDIMNVLNDKHIAIVTDSDFQNPNPDFVFGLFTNILIYLDVIKEDSKVELIKPKAEELRLLVEENKKCDEKLAKVNAEIAKYEEARERELPLVEELEENIEQLKHTISELNNQLLSLRTNFLEMKEKNILMDYKISKADAELEQAKKENKNLRSQILQSPQKLEVVLEEKKLMLAEAKKAERSAMESYHKETALFEVHQKVKELEAMNNEIKALKDKISEDEAEYSKLQAKLAKLEELQETLKQLEEAKEAVLLDWTKKLNELKVQVQAKRRGLEARKSVVASVLAKVNANNAKAKEVKQKGESQAKQLADEYEKILKQFREYVASFDELIKGYD
ncbi:unnamed protein product [Cochlearia groenlandica]